MSGKYCQKLALKNALSSIKQNGRFPYRVFRGEWADFQFFDPHVIFEACFIDIKNLFLNEKETSIIALLNLRANNWTIHEDDANVIFLDKDIGFEQYSAKLKGDGSPGNWMFQMDRYICASDDGKWSIYCERENDLGVFAFQRELSKRVSSQVTALLKAKSINLALSSDKSQLFNFDRLVPNWISTLMVEYVPS